jgi:hypothetical protein
VFASHFPSDEVQNEVEIRGSTPVSANDWGKNTTPVAVLIEFALYWAWSWRHKTSNYVDLFYGILYTISPTNQAEIFFEAKTQKQKARKSKRHLSSVSTTYPHTKRPREKVASTIAAQPCTS